VQWIFDSVCAFDAVWCLFLVFSIVAVLDIVVPVLRNPRCSLANFATRGVAEEERGLLWRRDRLACLLQSSWHFWARFDGVMIDFALIVLTFLHAGIEMSAWN
jgi:hypothetical protein